jgi:hypothetical protein
MERAHLSNNIKIEIVKSRKVSSNTKIFIPVKQGQKLIPKIILTLLQKPRNAKGRILP